MLKGTGVLAAICMCMLSVFLLSPCSDAPYGNLGSINHLSLDVEKSAQ